MNKYLEKIAAGSLVGKLAKSVVGVAGDGVKAIGKQFSHATGGAYVDHAISKGITSPHLLARTTAGKKEFSRVMQQAPVYKNSLHKISPLDNAATVASKKAKNKALHKEYVGALYRKGGDFEKLQEKTRRARIASAAITGGAVLGYNKLKDRASEINNRHSNQYAY